MASNERLPGARAKLVETVRVLAIALVIAMVVRVLLFQPFSIPSGSMKATLLVGDYLFVSKYSYGYSRHSIPFAPKLFPGRIFASEPKRGDVIVFKYPKDPEKDYIKRLIGLPGDRVGIREGVVHINGVALNRRLVGTFSEPIDPAHRVTCRSVARSPGGGRLCVKEIWRESLPGGRGWDTLNSDDNGGRSDNFGPVTVPAGHYFFLGDNRDNSVDSRYGTGVGFVPFENIVGRARIIFLSSRTSPLAFWRWRIERFFSVIH